VVLLFTLLFSLALPKAKSNKSLFSWRSAAPFSADLWQCVFAGGLGQSLAFGGQTLATWSEWPHRDLEGSFGQAACSTRVSISLRSIPKSIGLVKSASAPLSNALCLVSASP